MALFTIYQTKELLCCCFLTRSFWAQSLLCFSWLINTKIDHYFFLSFIVFGLHELKTKRKTELPKKRKKTTMMDPKNSSDADDSEMIFICTGKRSSLLLLLGHWCCYCFFSFFRFLLTYSTPIFRPI